MAAPDAEDSGKHPETPGKQRWITALLRFGAILAFVALVLWLMDWATGYVDTLSPGSGDVWMYRMIWALIAAYVVLIAVPFVPGIEIGLSLMIMRGPDIAVSVYVATVLGLTLAFCAGRLVKLPQLAQLLSTCGMERWSASVNRLAGLSFDARKAMLRDGLPRGLAPVLVDYRYLTLALILNLPGNALLGGGGGISFLAGFSRMFSVRGFVLTVTLAVLPVPFLVWAWGWDVWIR